ncbi:MAG: 4-(cytidine 5'-diphospho)-2-C-methyl-D-erythritol kinase [Deltaproteobacteria bacterium]|nr:4-(cytidine 5'-diphospho)-2-C-methyl-D-erythritol kinase [Deltaproteobacteria bacterium]
MKVMTKAPAKINLFLHIIGLRPDGFHEIESVFVPLELHDIVTVEVSPIPGVIIECPGFPEIENKSNLVYKALSRILDLSKNSGPPGFKSTILKKIPICAGLGGGSSDAAAALLAANRLLSRPVEKQSLLEIALDIGSDVPFFLGSGPAWVRGRGEIIEPVLDLPKLPLVLIKPTAGMSTKQAYSMWDEHSHFNNIKGLTYTHHSASKPAFNGNVAQVANLLCNDLEVATARCFDSVALSIGKLLDAGAMAAAMSGSGPTVFGLFASAAEAQEVGVRLSRGTDSWIVVTRSLNH